MKSKNYLNGRQFGMDLPRPTYSSRSESKKCPILDVTKVILFGVISAFVLYWPLGDPGIHCSPTHSTYRTQTGYCYLCDVYKVMTSTVSRTSQFMEFLSCVLLEVLYDAKLKFYAILEHVDSRDLCRSVCCSADVSDRKLDQSKECPGRVVCKCMKCKCCKK